MRYHLKSEMKQSMDALHFSAEDKSAMVQNLLAQSSQEKKEKFSGRKVTIIVLAAALAVVMLTGAAVFTRWSATAQNRYKPSQQVKEQAEKSGLSVMLEETKGSENPNEVLSVTDQGITVTVVQTIVDEYSAELTFRIEGFDLPEDRDPEAWPIVTIDGDEHFYTSQGGGFFDGTTRNEAGEWVYVSNGQPVAFRQDKFQSAILDWVAEDGSLEYTHYISFHETDGRYLGKEIQVKFPYIGIQSNKKAGLEERVVEGDWTLRWTLTGTSDSVKTTPNAQIGDSGVILLDAKIGQRTIFTRYQVKEYWEGWDELVQLPQGICGVRMRDGSEHICGPSSFGFEDQENMIYFIESTMYDAILDPSQVESLMFHKGWEQDANGDLTVETFYYIPVSAS